MLYASRILVADKATLPETYGRLCFGNINVGCNPKLTFRSVAANMGFGNIGA
jgi:hypothetical protein